MNSDSASQVFLSGEILLKLVWIWTCGPMPHERGARTLRLRHPLHPVVFSFSLNSTTEIPLGSREEIQAS